MNGYFSELSGLCRLGGILSLRFLLPYVADEATCCCLRA